MNDKKILITGFSGFVARHFVEYLYTLDVCLEVYGIDIKKPLYDIGQYLPRLKISFQILDMTNAEQLTELFNIFTPDYVLHLAAYSSVAYSWINPVESFMNNSNIFLNLIKEIREHNPNCRVLSVGSSEEYGNVKQDNLPIREEQAFSPTSPYAVARVSQELLAKVFSEAFHLDIILTRSFNHIGPRQDERFVVPSFISKILQIKRRGMGYGVIETGDISIIRDFVDVRDVTRAYYLLLLHGAPGEVYNICTGKGISLQYMIGVISKQIGVKISTKVDSNLIRPRDNKIIIGSPTKIMRELGWKPQIDIEKTIHDMIKYQESLF